MPDTGTLPRLDTATELACAYMRDDADDFCALLRDAPRMPVLLGQLARLFREASFYAIAAVLDLPLAEIDAELDVVRAWRDQQTLVLHELQDRLGLDCEALPAAVDWLTAVLRGERWIPATDRALCLTLAVAMVGEMFGGGFCLEWLDFVISREAARDRA